ncbi:MAG: tricarboxylate transporter [Pseudomonadota bacterium]
MIRRERCRWRPPFCACAVMMLMVSVGALVTPASADVDFSGQTIEWIIPFREGGGSDTWARFNAPFLARHLPGNPEIVIRNVPGGSSTKGVNRYAQGAPANGLSLLGTSASTQFPFLLGDSRVRYDYAQWRVLMVYPTGGIVYVRPELGVSRPEELAQLRGKRLVYGSQGATSLDLVPLLGFELLGLDVRPIFGIRGRSAAQLAFQRGDATIDFQTSAAYFRNVEPLVAAGEAIPLFTLGALNSAGELVRDPQFPDLPHLGEVYATIHGKPPSGLDWDSWFAFFSAGFGAQKLLVVPRTTPDDVIAAYEAAFERMQRDPEYLARRTDALGAYEQVTGDAAERLYRLASDVPDRPRQWIKAWLRRTYNLNI